MQEPARTPALDSAADDRVVRFRLAAELIAHPGLRPYKEAVPSLLSPPAREVLGRTCGALLRWVWTCVEKRYGVNRTSPFCAVFRDKLSALALTPDAQAALDVALDARQHGDDSAPVKVVVVAPALDTATWFELRGNGVVGARCVTHEPPESFIAMGAALAYEPPPWLGQANTA